MHRHMLTHVSISTYFLGILLLGATAFAADDPIGRTPAIGPDATFHFQPKGTVFGDPIPFYHDGVHHVFYLGRYQKSDGKLGGLQWSHLASRDLVTWKQLPAAIVPDETEPFIKKT